MKNKLKILSLLCLFLISCEDVIEVQTENTDKRLIIDGLILVDPNQQTTPVAIKASISSGFFEELKPAKLSNIYLRLENGGYINLFELQPNSGIYQPSGDEVFPGEISTSILINQKISLVLEYNGETYQAEYEYTPTVPLDNLEFGNGDLFQGDETEVKVSFTDKAGRADYYLFDFDYNNYFVSKDEFYDGQEFEFSYFYDEDLPPGEQVEVKIIGINKDFYNYMSQIIVQSNTEFNFFQTPVATVRGNIFNVSRINNDVNLLENFPLGYFAICGFDSARITAE
ncbi:hypothetical protein C7S20_00685 [Christiangramia fulva]|uniref:DUF4249 domain-containing protein n=1 Tax=Christiangramia fulva TaxID=2126553 RepID=A0A2R3Z0W5_9FLAO|nr:DUF4249 family protein [Christiangramia fulva]AVR43907.1 hypothetical protein C7S20_00685 [Christiangramia fulva]